MKTLFILLSTIFVVLFAAAIISSSATAKGVILTVHHRAATMGDLPTTVEVVDITKNNQVYTHSI